MTKLLMFSGGLDSTYILYDTLKNTDDDIWVHHIILKNRVEVRWKEELKAAREIMNYCRQIRTFNYSESEWGFGFTKYFGWDIEIVVFTAAQIVPNIPGDKIQLVTGRVKDDDKIQSSNNQTKYTQLVWEAAIAKFGDKTDKEINRPLRDRWKKDLVKELPKELLQKIWYCRSGNQGRPCGRCKSCRDMQEAIKVLRPSYDGQ